MSDDIEAAIFEYLGLDGFPTRIVPGDTADKFEVWTFNSIGQERLANIKHRLAAGFGVTSELGSMTPYDVPRLWAAAFDDAKFEGIHYESRFTPGCDAIAAFGDVGANVSSVGVKVKGREACRLAGVVVQDTPVAADLTIVPTPPGRSE